MTTLIYYYHKSIILDTATMEQTTPLSFIELIKARELTV
jgi:hypothetical protein